MFRRGEDSENPIDGVTAFCELLDPIGDQSLSFTLKWGVQSQNGKGALSEGEAAPCRHPLIPIRGRISDPISKIYHWKGHLNT